MSRRTGRDLSGTAYCGTCNARAEYDALKTLVIRHADDCPERDAKTVLND